MYKKIVLKYFILSLVCCSNVVIGMAENFSGNSQIKVLREENFLDVFVEQKSDLDELQIIEAKEQDFPQIFAGQNQLLDGLQELIQDETDLNQLEQLKFSEVVKSLLKSMKPSIDIFRKGQKDINSILLKYCNREIVKINDNYFGDHLKNVLCVRVRPIINKMNDLIYAEEMLEIQRNELTEDTLKMADEQCIQINLEVAEYVEQILHNIALLKGDLKLTEEGRFNLYKKDGRFLSKFLTLMKTHEIDRSLDSYYIPMLKEMIDYLTNGIEFQELILGLLMMKVVTVEMISYMEIIQANMEIIQSN